MKIHFAATALAIGATLFAQSASAEISGSATLHGVGFELIDLDTNDGITPYISFYSANNRIYTFSLDENGVTTGQLATNGAQPFSASYQSGSSRSFSNLLGGNVANMNMGGSTAGGSYQTTIFSTNDFTLSPMTQLVVHGNVKADVQFTGNQTVSGSSSAYMDLSLLGMGTSNYSRRLDADNWSANHQAFSEYFSVDVVNNLPYESDGTYYAALSANGFSDVSAVPEPETYGMMLGGLSVLALMARRRQKRA